MILYAFGLNQEHGITLNSFSWKLNKQFVARDYVYVYVYQAYF